MYGMDSNRKDCQQQQQGQGKGTTRKEEGFAVIFRASLAISKGGSALSWPYWHIDCNSGCGINDRSGDVCDGSPIVFLKEAVASGRCFHSYFCDKDETATKDLNARVASVGIRYPNIAEVVCEDNGAFLRRMAIRIRSAENPKYAIGSVIVDPNGFQSQRESAYPRDALKEFAQEFPRIDLILNLNISLFARVQGCKRNSIKGFDAWPTIDELMDELNRRHWLVRSPGKNPGEKFVTLVGRNIESGQNKIHEFYRRESVEGRHILEKLSRPPVGQLEFQFMEEKK